jgi:hypothetical protein
MSSRLLQIYKTEAGAQMALTVKNINNNREGGGS